MEPAFYRGDLLFLTNNCDDPVQAGEILVFKVKDRDIPIVHRVIKVHERYICLYFMCICVVHVCIYTYVLHFHYWHQQ